MVTDVWPSPAETRQTEQKPKNKPEAVTGAWSPGDLTSSNKVTQSPGFQIWLEPQFSLKGGHPGFLLAGYQPHLKLRLLERSIRRACLNIDK